MEQNSEVVIHFESALRRSYLKKQLTIYNQKTEVVPPKSYKRSYTSKDVLTNISKQLNALQRADSIKKDMNYKHNLLKYKKSTLEPVNLLSLDNIKHQNYQNVNKFETQCVSDTQLINIVEYAEKQVQPEEVTQEFEYSFCEQHVKYEKEGKKRKNSLCSENTKLSSDLKGSLERHKETAFCNSIFEENVPDASKEDINMENNACLSKLVEVENVDIGNCNVHVSQDNIKVSPIINYIEPIIFTNNRSPIMCTLDAFEDFEALAFPVVEKNADLKTAKQLINSKILEKELYIGNHIKPNIDEAERSPSPTWSIIKKNKLLPNSPTPNNKEMNNIATAAPDKRIVMEQKKQNEEDNNKYFEDEILFSSDEENNTEEDFRELPITCALETSFYNQCSFLDRTMYVGFQTASNRSIQISTESFSKAQSILEDLDVGCFDATLTELVALCDGPSRNNVGQLNINDSIKDKNIENSIKDKTKEGSDNGTHYSRTQSIYFTDTSSFKKEENLPRGLGTGDKKCDDDRTKHKICLNNIESMSLNENDLNHNSVTIRKSEIASTDKSAFIEFYTASNKRIQPSEKALTRCRQVFQDIDLDEKYDDTEFENMLCSIEPKSSPFLVIQSSFEEKSKTRKLDTPGSKCNDSKKDQVNIVNEQGHLDDLLIVQEFENGLMSHYNDGKVHLLEGRFSNIIDVKENNQTVSKCVEDLYEEVPHNKDCSKIYEEKLHDQTKAFMGFKTASNKQINISEHALAKTKNIFDDLVISDNYDKKFHKDIVSYDTIIKNNSAISSNETTKTDKNRISEKAFCKIFQGFAEENRQSIKNAQTNSITGLPFFSNRNNNDMNILGSHGFKTANNKPIFMSSKALVISKRLFEQIDSSVLDVTDLNSEVENISIQGFKTVSKSDEALPMPKNSYKDINNDKVKNHDLNKIVNDPQNYCNSQGSLALISVNDAAEEKNTFSSNDLGQNNDDKAFKGFQTASNKPVRISYKALAESKKIFQDLDLDENMEKHNTASKNAKPDETNVKTGTNISEFATHMNKQNLLVDKPNLPDQVFKGFHTASNRLVKISHQALAKSKQLFQNLQLHENHESNKVNHCMVDGKQPVSRNSSVGVFTKPKTKFQSSRQRNNNDFNKHDLPIGKQSLDRHDAIFKGFQTASNKQVKITEKALIESKKIFQDLDLNENYEEQIDVVNKKKIECRSATKKHSDFGENKLCAQKENIPDQYFKGFQTANNKRVKISEEALAKSKKLFLDLENEDNQQNKGNQNICHGKSTIMCGSSIHNNNLSYTTKVSKGNDLEFISTNNDYIKAKLKSKNILFDLNQNNETITKEIAVNCEEHIGLGNIINTQVLNNFENTLYTEDFCKDRTPKKSKRSGSPILSCPRAKRRARFEVPYRNEQISKLEKTIKLAPERNISILFDFDEKYKQNKKYTLNTLRNVERLNDNQNVVDPYILSFNFGTVLNFEFADMRNELCDVKWSTKDVKKYFLSLVNKKMIPDGWLDNHLTLIISKLLSYEIAFKNTMQGVCSVKNVLEQLKYRYDRELYNVERPAFRKLLERDDVSTKTMILRVIAIYSDGIPVTSVSNTKNIELLLTDGWYCIKACLDQLLLKLVCNQKIRIGTKLATHGAELLNCEQGIAPWEDTSSVRLKIFGNSTRRARWDARLGYYGLGAILTQLSCVELEGGKVSKLRALVTRVYPTLYVEKFEDGSTVTRSERLELLHQMKYESERQELLEKIYEEVEKEFTDQESQDLECDAEVRSLDSGTQISRRMKMSKDPGEFRGNLTNTQCMLLQEFTTRRREKQLQSMQARVEQKLKARGLHTGRNVVPVLKIRIADFGRNGEVSTAMMSIWRPNDAVLDIIKEGTWIDVYNTIPTAMRYSEMQLSAGRQTVFRQSKYKEHDKIQHITARLNRFCSNTKDLVENVMINTDYNEVDTLGLIFLIDPSINKFESIKGQLFQNVYLTDSEKNVICVNFWGGLRKFGYENVLDTGQVVACMNLQKRAGNNRRSIPQFRATEFSYFTKTPKLTNVRKMVDDLNKTLSKINVKKLCEDCITIKNNYSIFKNKGDNISPYRMNYSDYNVSKHKPFVDSPLMRKRHHADDILNLSGLDFESTFKQIDTQDMSSSMLLRKKNVNEKIAKLKMYGEPPPLNSIHIINKSKNATSAFKSPLTSKNDISKSVASENDIVNNIDSSPVISVNKNCIKGKSTNPVKLNFSNDPSKETDDVSIEVVDPFAEEFDASPPLSLD